MALYVASAEFKTRGDGLVTVSRGDVVEVTRKTAGALWWTVVTREGKEGHVPRAVLTEYAPYAVAKASYTPPPDGGKIDGVGLMGVKKGDVVVRVDPGDPVVFSRTKGVQGLDRPTPSPAWTRVKAPGGSILAPAKEGYVPSSYLAPLRNDYLLDQPYPLIASYSYTPKNRRECTRRLDIRKGDLLLAHAEESGWALVETVDGSAIGFVPRSYLRTPDEPKPPRSDPVPPIPVDEVGDGGGVGGDGVGEGGEVGEVGEGGEAGSVLLWTMMEERAAFWSFESFLNA